MNTATTFPPVPDNITGHPHECNVRCRGGLHCKVEYVKTWGHDDAAVLEAMQRDYARVYGCLVERIERAVEARPCLEAFIFPWREEDKATWQDASAYLMFYRLFEGCP